MSTGSAKTFTFKKVTGEAAKQQTGAKVYSGPRPPADTYRVQAKRLWLHKNKGGPTIEYLFEINEDREKYKKYNGYPIWGRQNITDQGMGYVNQLLIALGDGPKYLDAFHETGVIKTKADERAKNKDGSPVMHVQRIGDEPLKSPGNLGLLVVTAKENKWEGKVSLQTTSYIPLSESNLGSEDVASDDNDDDAEDAEDAEYISDEEEAEEAEAEDDDDGEDWLDDEEE